MVKHTLEGLSILNSPPLLGGNYKAPVVTLDDGLIIDDRILEAPTLIMGNVGSGKSFILQKMMDPIVEHADKVGDNVFIFCAKKELLLKYKRDGDVVIAIDTKDPNSCWNIFREMDASANPELCARNIAKSLLKDKKSDTQPFFVNAASDLLCSVLLAIYEDGLNRGIAYSNWHICDFFKKVKLKKINDDDLTWYDLAQTRPERFSHILDYIGEGLDQGYGIISEIQSMVFDSLWGSFASKNGTFSAIESLKKGQRIFLYYDHANASEASIIVFKTILDLLLKHAVDEENNRKSWLFIDEFSLLPKTGIIDSMSLGRGLGFRLTCCIQSAQLMGRHYTEDETKALLSLFPNIISLKVQDELSRKILSERYGESLCSYTFSTATHKSEPHTEHRPVVADYDFSMIQRKGDAIMSIPNLSNCPFIYSGYRKELDT